MQTLWGGALDRRQHESCCMMHTEQTGGWADDGEGHAWHKLHVLRGAAASRGAP